MSSAEHRKHASLRQSGASWQVTICTRPHPGGEPVVYDRFVAELAKAVRE